MPMGPEDGGMPSFDEMPQQQPIGQQPDMGMENGGGDINNMLGGGENEPQDDDENFSQDGGDENFDNDFDAGVEANEDDDPEKYLQQLTGKLCDKLKKFNDKKPKPDAGMCKYIAGMVLAQCVKGLDEDEKDEILSKLTKDSEDGDDYENDNQDESNVKNNNEDEDFDNETGNDDFENEDNSNDLNEAKKIVERIVQNVKNDIVNKKPKGMSNKRKSYKMTPYMAPDFN